MFEYLIGTITDVTPQNVVVEVHGVGYLVYTANPYRFNIGDTDQTVYIHQAVTDSSQTLFGFVDQDEKRLFEKLINVSGIGPKSALPILASDDHRGIISAINQENVTFLTKFPGVGKKTAQQIVLDLKGKLGDLAAEVDLLTSPTAPSASTNQALDDALDALVALGYKAAAVKKIGDSLADGPVMTTNDYLSTGLKQLTK